MEAINVRIVMSDGSVLEASGRDAEKAFEAIGLANSVCGLVGTSNGMLYNTPTFREFKPESLKEHNPLIELARYNRWEDTLGTVRVSDGGCGPVVTLGGANGEWGWMYAKRGLNNRLDIGYILHYSSEL